MSRNRPTLEESFKVAKVREIILKVLQQVLADKPYSDKEAGKWTIEITETINKEICALQMDQYKHVVQVIIGEAIGAGSKYIARAVWDVESDHLLSEQLVNAHLFCSVAVFGIYC